MLRARISAFVLVLGWAGAAGAATLVDSALKFRVLPTAHFLIYFHQGEEALAARLAGIAEEAWTGLRSAQGATPPALTHVLLVDQTDSANGWATPVPRNTIMITAVWPAGSDFIGNTDDWLRVVFVHEFTHIVHLDRSEKGARVVRGIFGRLPVAFPNLFLPAWQIEGFATYQESLLTPGGRLHAGDFAAITAEAARGGALEPLDRVNGGLTDWPGGLAPYAYGLGFHQYLVDRFGPARLAELSDRSAARLPFTASLVFRDVYGESLGELWKGYLAGLTTTVAEAGLESRATPGTTRITRDGFTAIGPRFDPYPCGGCPAKIFYSVRTPHGFPMLNAIVSGGAPQSVATRYLGSTAAIGRDTIYFDQREMRRNAGVYSDLHAFDRASGRVTRLTREGRLLDPDLSPDGSTLTCVRVAPGRRELVTVATGAAPESSSVAAQDFNPAVRVLISEPETQFDAPRWSPDGRSIAVERHRLGAWPEIVVVDAATSEVTLVAAADRTRFATPAWRPDGRALVAAMAPDDEPFNLYEIAASGNGVPRRLTNTTGGATWPDVSPDGTTIVYVGYTTSGFDLFTVPYSAPPALPDTPAPPALPDTPASPARPDSPAPPALLAPAKKYSPLPTLTPTWWSPIVEGDANGWRAGAETGGFDVLGYHAYALSASWLTSHPDGAPSFSTAHPDWSASYAYTRWRPLWWVAASSTTSFFGGPPSDSGQATIATLREQELGAGVVMPFRHVRVVHTIAGSLVYGSDALTLVDGSASSRRTAVRAGWSTSSARTYGFSVGPEEGFKLGATAELARRSLGSGATAFTVDGRAYLPAIAPHHVLALRVAGGASGGERSARRTFLLGGPAPNGEALSFGRGAISLLRGFASNTFAGNHVALLNADYRFPIARPQRGAGTWPGFIHTIHGAAFADAGHAWTRTFAVRDIKTSLGGELSADVVAGYSFRVTVTAGAAWGHDGRGTISDRATAYIRLGHAF